MTQKSDKWVTDWFGATAQDWACPAFADRVLYIPTSSDRTVTEHCASVLGDELERADRFLTGRGRANFIQRRAFRRYCGAVASGTPLSQIAFEETENGRPYLPEHPKLWFSFSSCRLGFLGAWSSTHAIGIDLEDQNGEIEASELARSYFTISEAQAVEEAGPARLRTFLQLWSLKEAALKSIGEGLPFGLDTFAFELNGPLRIRSVPRDHGAPDRFAAHIFEHADVCAALVGRPALFHDALPLLETGFSALQTQPRPVRKISSDIS